MSPPPAFGTYRVLHQIGSGVLGPVFRAYDSQQDRLVAVKTFKLDLVPEDAVRLADRLRAIVATPPPHPAVVRAMDAGLQKSTPFIALEYASGESLDVVLRQSGRWPLARTLPILQAVAEAVDAAWAAGVGHGALHPRDIFLDSGGSDVRITGFGIGQALESIGARVPVRRPYSAPERANGPGWDARADVYSLAVVAHEMLSGQRPLGSDADDDGVAMDVGSEARAAVRRVLATAMSESPADRHDTAARFVSALATAAAAETVAAAAATDTALPEAEPAAVAINRARPVVLVPPPVVAPPPVLRLPVTERSVRASGIEVDRPNPPVEPHDDELSSFPWAAMAAVLVAGVVVGAVGGYQFGWHRGSLLGQVTGVATTVPVVSSVPAPTPASTPEPAPPVSAPAVASAAAAPTRGSTSMGRLVIQSVPSGALVTLDGQRVGETPVRTSASIGRHEVQIARPGYVPRIERVELTSRAPSRTVSVQLRRGGDVAVPATGAVDVDSRPQKAQVTVDGRPVGITPLRVPELTAGSHRVQIALAGHKAVTSTVHIVGGEITRLTVTLEQGGVAMAGWTRGVR